MALCVLLRGKIKNINDYRWNFVLINESRLEEIKDAIIVHYCDDNKAWENYGKNEIISLWWDYAKKTQHYVEYLENSAKLLTLKCEKINNWARHGNMNYLILDKLLIKNRNNENLGMELI